MKKNVKHSWMEMKTGAGPNSLGFASRRDFSIVEYDYASKLFRGDYSPPSPSPPSPPPHPPSLSCEDLKGIGSVNTTCELSYSLNFTDDVYVEGRGNFFILQGVALTCPKLGCSIVINVTGEFRLNSFAEIVAGSVFIVAGNASLFGGSVINVTARAAELPEPSKGTPDDAQGGGAGHGGRGASCVMDNKKLPEDVWGGDAYSWESLDKPWSYGSSGGTTNREEDYGGEGEGGFGWRQRILQMCVECFWRMVGMGNQRRRRVWWQCLHQVTENSRTGSGKICASGGTGFAGGGGGRVSVNVFSRHDDPIFFVHGGRSFGCPMNAGAAGTFFDAVPRRLVIDNHNMSTDTDTLLLQFPNQPLWTNVYIQNRAQATVPLLWSRVQVRGQLSLSCGAVLSFGLVHYALSEFELMAEELLMSDSIVYGALRMSVKIHLMLNSKMLISGDSDAIVATSLLEASNLVVLKGSSMIHSTANLGLHGQGSLNLSGPGDVIEAQHLVGPGSVLRGPLENASDNNISEILTCKGTGCISGLGHGELLPNGLSSGAGHGGRGGDAYYGGTYIRGGTAYGNAELPCELGSGSGNESLPSATAGGGVIVMGSLEHSLTKLVVHGEIKADGETYGKYVGGNDGFVVSDVSPGGGSGGTVLLFVHNFVLDDTATISTSGGHGSPNAGGGGGGRIHFHWSDIPIGDEYMPMAIVKGTIRISFLNVSLMITKGDGGVMEAPCPYKCISERYHMPHCYTALEELIYTFGGPWLFGFILLSLLILLALVLSVARMKFAGGDELPGLVPNRRGSTIDRSFPFLESLNEILGTLMHLLPCSVDRYEDAFNIFVDEINALASYEWWEGSVYGILCVIAYPLAWSWLQWRRKEKVQHLREYVRSEYDHACLRSCRSRALYEGLKVAATSDFMLAYVDFFLGGDEKRDDLPPRLHQRFPMSLVFGGDGSYMVPFSLHSDNILTNLMSQSVPPTIWYRLVAGLNAHLRLVRRGHLRSTFRPVILWLETHANRTLRAHGVRVDLTCFQPSASGYCQFGLVVCAIEGESSHSSGQGPDRSLLLEKQSR
ncbi:hypothetical protein DH2020_018699 [Rehmannia glutinosa]|uniref:Uncharacterized protein n=1 Tax=Rehmannia glutinosa TaxID=99300 RepID=A0ABR0WK08_REHGL